MSIWSYNNSLTDIQNSIISQITNHMGIHVMMGSILNIDYEDYQILTSKLDAIKCIEETEKYCISIIAAWVVSSKFRREPQFFNEMYNIFKSFPQHYHSYVMEMFASTFYNYQIDTMGVTFRSTDDIRKVVLRHSE